MNAETLIKALQTVHPKARVTLAAMPKQQGLDNGTGACAGDIVYISVAEVDGVDTLVTLTNCVADAAGDLVFDVKPQFKRFRVSTQQGGVAAAADLREQLGCEATHDLDAHLDLDSIRQLFRSMEDHD